MGTAGLAEAARHCRPCHPDLAGTRALTVHGDVARYAFVGGRVVVQWVRSAHCAGTAVWDYGSMRRETASAGCQRRDATAPRGSGERLVAAQGDRVVRVVEAPASVDRPDRLVVLDRTSHRRLASWPLIDHPARVALYGDIAILSQRNRHALYAVRISDGRIALVGITRAGDRPLIGPKGVLYQDDLDVMKHKTSPHKVTLKLLPLKAIRRELDRTGREIRTSRINAISMDGPRVAFAVHDPRGSCDRVLFWNIPWHFVSRLTQHLGPTCLPTHAPGGITDVAIGGSRAVWTTRYGAQTRVLAASIIQCQEWVVARPTEGIQNVAGLSGDGAVLAFALGDRSSSARQTSSVKLVPSEWRGSDLVQSRRTIRALSVDTAHVATLYNDGVVTIVRPDGGRERTLRVGGARAIALRRGTLAVLERKTLDVYDVQSGRRLHSWKTPSGATSVDLHFGIVLLSAGRDVLAVNASTGRQSRLLRAPGRVAAQLEAPGAAIQFNVKGHGYLRFVPMSVIEARTR